MTYLLITLIFIAPFAVFFIVSYINKRRMIKLLKKADKEMSEVFISIRTAEYLKGNPVKYHNNIYPKRKSEIEDIETPFKFTGTFHMDGDNTYTFNDPTVSDDSNSNYFGGGDFGGGGAGSSWEDNSSNTNTD